VRIFGVSESQKVILFGCTQRRLSIAAPPSGGKYTGLDLENHTIHALSEEVIEECGKNCITYSRV
jgi:hypothetical protein